MGVINFIIENILTQASITIALIAMLGLILQKKSMGQVLSGSLKTLLGFQVLSAGSSIIVGSLQYFGEIFTEGFGMQGIIPSIEAINGQAMNQLGLGRDIALTFLGIFIFNILIARFTKWKYIFLTGQAILWMATMTTVLGYFVGLRGITLILTGSLVGAIFAVAMPAIAQPIIRKITGTDDIALGHFCTIGYMFEAGVAYIFGERGENKKSIEDIKLPKAFDFLQDTYLSVMVVMVPLYIITAIFAGPEVGGHGDQNYLMFAFLQAIQFVVGVYVLMAGVRLLLGEIVPAFRGIAMKIVPNAIPALDCPVFFPYSPNAVILGFITTTIGTVIAMFLLPTFGLAMILPGMLTNFFAGGTAGIFGNAVGGRRGAIIGGIAHGFFITLLPALLVTIFNSMGFINATATDVDTVVAALLYAWILSPILKAF
ncbi:PTS system ascorbate-specific transporter subunit IIC [Enterococcus phoeniculicola]|jgi:PTS system ascorbate-specific IIC component|uniref:Ascorbate-specific PTS system EIIC component n=1 Tax=Enterococcus phoeniculicola ATCC BAA-412 TaxID=1158610 RepID=R3WN77_9ENTE|nr:PTS sugar transporter subunit IIC [Enterococcus phoeniculicola]EOL48887.1 PTS system ascorbate-specific transporter subunit IIC [Enterococcus phoeniculicola ATCC BAA-412]EOT72733.1 PTS system ascorbate-specific transporter subunit IIC [Enterococcus phoeniculicola ATCC BAA-412]OJG70780.1 PTS system ascorbate-specific transporter subunit IIC [Enterococcus phoeniculicola]